VENIEMVWSEGSAWGGCFDTGDVDDGFGRKPEVPPA